MQCLENVSLQKAVWTLRVIAEGVVLTHMRHEQKFSALYSMFCIFNNTSLVCVNFPSPLKSQVGFSSPG